MACSHPNVRLGDGGGDGPRPPKRLRRLRTISDYFPVAADPALHLQQDLTMEEEEAPQVSGGEDQRDNKDPGAASSSSTPPKAQAADVWDNRVVVDCPYDPQKTLPGLWKITNGELWYSCHISGEVRDAARFVCEHRNGLVRKFKQDLPERTGYHFTQNDPVNRIDRCLNCLHQAHETGALHTEDYRKTLKTIIYEAELQLELVEEEEAEQPSRFHRFEEDATFVRNENRQRFGECDDVKTQVPRKACNQGDWTLPVWSPDRMLEVNICHHCDRLCETPRKCAACANLFCTLCSTDGCVRRSAIEARAARRVHGSDAMCLDCLDANHKAFRARSRATPEKRPPLLALPKECLDIIYTELGKLERCDPCEEAAAPRTLSQSALSMVCTTLNGVAHHAPSGGPVPKTFETLLRGPDFDRDVTLNQKMLFRLQSVTRFKHNMTSLSMIRFACEVLKFPLIPLPGSFESAYETDFHINANIEALNGGLVILSERTHQYGYGYFWNLSYGESYVDWARRGRAKLHRNLRILLDFETPRCLTNTYRWHLVEPPNDGKEEEHADVLAYLRAQFEVRRQRYVASYRRCKARRVFEM